MPNCSFQDAWLNDEEFKSWILRDRSCYFAFCKVCAKSFDIKSMGRSAVTSHMKGKKHKEKLRLRLSLPLTTYIREKNQSSSSLQNASISTNVSLSNPATTNRAFTTSQLTLNDVLTSNQATNDGTSSLVQPNDIKIECDPYTADGTVNISCNSYNDGSSNIEHVEESDGYLDTSYIQRPHPARKKPKMAAKNYDAISKLDKSLFHRETEFDIWAKSLAKQLNNMDLGRALRLQLKIQSLLTEERLEHEC